MKILLLTPPMTQLNTPYPATAYLTGFLRGRGYACEQRDPAIDLVLRLFSRSGIERIRAVCIQKKISTPTVDFFLENFTRYQNTAGTAIRFLQGKDPAASLRINSRTFLPEGPRFASLYEFAGDGSDAPDVEQLRYAFGTLGGQDQAKYLASLFLDDLSDVVRGAVDPQFEFTRYGEKLAASQSTFDALETRLKPEQRSLIDECLDGCLAEYFSDSTYDLVGLTVPFPGNVLGAFQIARYVRANFPKTKIALGGGYVNTELRELKDPRVFQYVDAITYDDGELPFLRLIDYFEGKIGSEGLVRTKLLFKGQIATANDTSAHDIPQKDVGYPTYDGLKLDSYLSILEFLNPMHRIWSDGRWNKLTLAHGCYWKKCNFCDVSLDYIGRYEASPVDLIVDRMERLIEETGQSGFHFVDEAAPPAVLRKLSELLIKRGVQATWWGNVRFEKSFDADLAELMAQAGCVAVSGGLEVASNRLLGLINKGVSVEQVARVTRDLTANGIMVHAYLMYGFPSQTVQETVDSLELVRQLFETGCLQSAFWHRFSVTAHSPVGLSPEKFGVDLLTDGRTAFAKNDLPFRDRSGVNFDHLGEGLRKALYNYMNGVGFELDVREWFEGRVPKAKIKPGYIASLLG